jgi:DNA invertase Pin-like site-specific DNA recombinase
MINALGPERKFAARKAVILARVSSKEQEDGFSIEAQRYRLEHYCTQKRLEVIRCYEIVESSTSGDRKQFLEMLKFVKAQKQTIAIVADKVDRVQRSFKEYPMLDALIQQGKIELHFNTENYVIHRDSLSQERLMWSMGVIMAQSYVDNLRDNVKRSIEQKVRQGEWIAMAPIGYLNTRENERGNIVVDPARAPLIAKLFNTYATGAYSVSQLRELTIEWGLKNKVGKKDFLPVSQIHRILNNPFYCGEMNIKGQTYLHKYPALISRDVYKKCQSVLRGWNKKPFKWRGKEYVFRGLITCALTGRVITADTKKKTYANGKIAEWTYLRSTDPANHSKTVWVREDHILKQVEELLFKLVPTSQIVLHSKEYLAQIADGEKKAKVHQISDAKRQRETLNVRLDGLMDFLLDGTIDRKDFERKRAHIQDKLDDLQNLLSANPKENDDFSKSMISIMKFCSEIIPLFEGSTIGDKRKILNFLFANLQLKGTSLCYSFNYPFDELVKCDTFEKWRPLVDSLRTNPKTRQMVIDLANTFDFNSLD